MKHPTVAALKSYSSHHHTAIHQPPAAILSYTVYSTVPVPSNRLHCNPNYPLVSFSLSFSLFPPGKEISCRIDRSDRSDRIDQPTSRNCPVPVPASVPLLEEEEEEELLAVIRSNQDSGFTPPVPASFLISLYPTPGHPVLCVCNFHGSCQAHQPCQDLETTTLLPP